MDSQDPGFQNGGQCVDEGKNAVNVLPNTRRWLSLQCVSSEDTKQRTEYQRLNKSSLATVSSGTSYSISEADAPQGAVDQVSTTRKGTRSGTSGTAVRTLLANGGESSTGKSCLHDKVHILKFSADGLPSGKG